MKRYLSILLSIVLLAGLLAGCGDSAVTPDSANGSTAASTDKAVKAAQKMDLTYWVTTNRQPNLDIVIPMFEKENPGVTVSPTYYTSGDLRKNLMVAASSNTLPSFWYQYSGSTASFYPTNGLTYNLNDYAKQHDWEKKFLPGTLELATFDGILSGYPQTLNTFGMIYRKDIFEANNIKVPTTFAEFEKVLADLKAAGVAPFGIGGKGGFDLLRLVSPIVEMYAGSELHDQMNALKASWNSEPVIKAFTKLKEWSDKGYFTEGFITQDQNDARMLWYAGKSVMRVDGSPQIQLLNNGDYDMNQYGYFKLPFIDPNGGSRMITYITVNQFNVKLTKEELEKSIEFNEFSLSENDAFNETKAYPMPYADAVIPKSLPMVDQMLADNAKSGSLLIGDQNMPSEIIDCYYQADDAVISGLMTPQKAAEFLQKSIETYLATKK